MKYLRIADRCYKRRNPPFFIKQEQGGNEEEYHEGFGGR